MEKPISAHIAINKGGVFTDTNINTDWMIVLYKGKDGKKHVMDCSDEFKEIKKLLKEERA